MPNAMILGAKNIKPATNNIACAMPDSGAFQYPSIPALSTITPRVAVRQFKTIPVIGPSSSNPSPYIKANGTTNAVIASFTAPTDIPRGFASAIAEAANAATATGGVIAESTAK
ncbi:hypothetical protein R50071_44770 [Halioxenophilus aromaticivorans]